MKASDLMLGDWTLCDGVHRKVSVLIEGQDARCGEPIELTTEILELNGFKVGNSVLTSTNQPIYFKEVELVASLKLTWRIEVIDNVISTRYSTEKQCHSYNVHIRLPIGSTWLVVYNVHEFQQLLRTAGLKDEANNFKVA